MKMEVSKNNILVAQFDDLVRCYNVLVDGTALREFLKYVQSKELERLKGMEATDECKRLKSALDKANKDISCLDSKLSSARRWVDSDRKARREVERERDCLREQLENVKKALFGDGKSKLTDEATKESLSFLYEDYRTGAAAYGTAKLSAITEMDSTSASNFSDISYSRSEDDLDEISRRSRSYRKHPSSSLADEITSTVKRARADNNTRKQQITLETPGCGEHLIATTTVKVPRDGPVSAKSVIETFPPIDPMKVDKIKYTTPKTEPPKSIAAITTYGSKYQTPSTVPTAPPNEDFTEALDVYKEKTPYTYETALDKINARQHCFVPKNVIMPESCVPCGKRVIFGKRVFKCTQCNVCAHLECKDKVPLPCMPIGTPSKGGVANYLHDYCPLVPPMVPALVIHCIGEIEQRGLAEIGLYRVPGAEKDVRMLKDKFLRGKGGSVDLSHYDIHSVCGCLKNFLCSLHESLIPRELFDEFTKSIMAEKQEDKTMLLFKAISYLAQPNRDTLAFLMLHLKRVASTPACKMSVENLAKVLALTVIGLPINASDKESAHMTTRLAISIMEELLNLSTDYWASFIVDPSEQLRTVWHTPSTESISRKTTRKILTNTPASRK